MAYDDGEVLQGLGDRWTFVGATAIEWASGVAVFLIISLFAESPARAMPFMLVGWVMTTTTLASLRMGFPDQERGLRNAIASACGFPPPDIPLPASLQPIWSACPLRELPPMSRFRRFGLDEVFPSFQEQLLDAEQLEQ